jgi:hypothetical protein
MTNMSQHKPVRVGDTVRRASRQMWLAGLGAAVVTRDWAEKEAGSVFRTLVREGSAMESRAIRFVGDRVEASVVRANVVWTRARASMASAVRAYADTAVSIVQQTLPRSLPKVEFAAAHTKAGAARTRKTARGQGVASAKRVKRGAKAATRR